jgi:hypothetical protein
MSLAAIRSLVGHTDYTHVIRMGCQSSLQWKGRHFQVAFGRSLPMGGSGSGRHADGKLLDATLTHRMSTKADVLCRAMKAGKGSESAAGSISVSSP